MTGQDSGKSAWLPRALCHPDCDGTLKVRQVKRLPAGRHSRVGSRQQPKEDEPMRRLHMMLASVALLALAAPAAAMTPTPSPTPTWPPTATPTATPALLEIQPAAVAASTSDINVPANAVDNNLSTRWSGYGDGAWI